MSRYPYPILSRSFTLWLTLLLLLGNGAPARAQDSTPQPERPPIRIGSKEFNEQLLLGKMLILLLQDAGYPVEDMTATGGSRAVRTALESGEIDLYPEYTGTALSLYHELPSEALPNSANRSYELAKSLDASQGLIWLQPAAINNTFTLMVRQDLLDQGIVSLTDLADYMNANEASLTLCVESEFFIRQDGLPGLQELYGFAFLEENILVMEPNETYGNLRQGSCDVAEGYATDGRIRAWGFTNLADPLAFFPFYNPAPVVREEILADYPDLPEVINELWQYLDNETMIALNARVDIGGDGILSNGDEETIEDVAYNFLISKRLLKPAPIKVGSKEFNEQLLIGQMIVLLLRDAGYEVEDRTGLGGSPVVRAALESGEIDLYPEYTGTATSLHHSLPVSALPADAIRTYLLARSLDAPQDLVWLDPAPLNNTFTLMVRQELADQGVTSLEELATYMNTNDVPLKICVEGEFFSRQDGLEGLQRLYGFAFSEENVLVMEPNETYDNLRNGSCEVAEGFATDGRINAWGFQTLADPLAFFPFYQPAPVVRAEILTLYPDIADRLNLLMQDLDDATMSALNARVDIGADGELASGDEEAVEDVAYSYLREKRLIKLPAIVVSAADTAESSQLILGKMLVMLLADEGYQVVDQTALGSGLLVREAIQKGAVDIYMESVATALVNYAGIPVTALPTDSKRAYQLMKSLDAAKGITWMGPTSYSLSYAIVAQPEVLDLNITGLDELAQYMNENDSPLSICMDNDFYSRSLDGLAGMEEFYKFHFKPENIFLVDAEDVYGAFAKGECDIAAGFNLEATVRNYTILADPLFFFPATTVAPVIRQAILDRNPELVEILAELVPLINNDTMATLEAAVELGADGTDDSGDEEEIDTVVRNFLLANGLIQDEPPAETDDNAVGGRAGADTTRAEPEGRNAVTDSGSPTDESVQITEATVISSIGGGLSGGDDASPIVVASMDYTEQQLLGKLIVLLLRAGGYSVVDQTGIGSSPDLRSALESGAVDLYLEFPRTALTLFHNIPANALPTDRDEAYQWAKSLDETLNLAWIRKASFDSAYALLVRQTFADTGIKSIDDLAAYVNQQTEPLQFCAETNALEQTPESWVTLFDLYGFTVPLETILTLSPDEIYSALQNGACDVAVALQTDGRIQAWNFTTLADPRGAFPDYISAPVVRRAVLDRYPELETYLGQLSERLDTAAIIAMNAQVELGADGAANTGDEVSIEAVANAFLCESGLIGECDPAIEPAGAPALALTDTATVAVSTPVISVTNPVVAVTLPDVSATVESTTTVEIITSDSYGVNGRATPNIGATVVTVLPRNTTVRAIGRTSDGDWLQIQLPDNQVVWVFTAAILTDVEALALLPIVASE